MFSFLIIFLYSQLILLPMLGIVWVGIRQENRRREQLFKEALKALHIVGVTRGRLR